ncbi:MAG: hypothetical protein E7298_01755 [Lachnospiraceae bacterium]|nr:hypothetical protein [Lachnospiraceae bacterium]
MNKRRYQLITDKFREFFFPTLSISMANNMAAFVDALLVSTFLGVRRLPAVQLCFPIVAFTSLFHGMFGIGGSLIAANAQADRDRIKGCRIFSVSVTSSAVVGILVAIFGTLFRHQIVSVICSNLNLQADVLEYYSVLVLGFPLMCLLMSLSFFVKADGCAEMASHSILISNGVNLLMDFVLMKGLGTGLIGAALATIIGYICGLLFLIIRYGHYPKRQFKLITPIPNGMKLFLDDIFSICQKGIPTASIWLYLMISVQITNNLVLSYGGALGVQAYTICRNSMSLAYIFFTGTAQTMSPIAGIYAHEGDYDRTRFVLKHSVRIVLVTALLMVGVFSAFPRSLLWLFGAAASPDADYFCKAIRVFTPIYPGLAFSFLMNYYFQAIEQKKLSAAVTTLEGFLLPVCLAYLLIPRFGMKGVWFALISAETITAILIIILLLWDTYGRKSAKRRKYLLPLDNELAGCEFSVETDPQEIVQLSEKASRYIEERTDHRTAVITCLALEEILTGIAIANSDTKVAIDVLLWDTEDEIIISVRDTGIGFNPLLQDPELSYSFSNAEVLKSIASQIKYDLVLGMNDTRIHLNRARHQESS